jgi:hypothetical protein
LFMLVDFGKDREIGSKTYTHLGLQYQYH